MSERASYAKEARVLGLSGAQGQRRKEETNHGFNSCINQSPLEGESVDEACYMSLCEFASHIDSLHQFKEFARPNLARSG